MGAPSAAFVGLVVFSGALAVDDDDLSPRWMTLPATSAPISTTTAATAAAPATAGEFHTRWRPFMGTTVLGGCVEACSRASLTRACTASGIASAGKADRRARVVRS